MPAINQKDPNHTVFINVNFILRDDKQRILIDILKERSGLEIEIIARLLHISTEKFTAVLEGSALLDDDEAEKLAKYFCIFCGS
ncbi:MAG: hypothetical protein NTU49_06485 [Gammaproteobacteria bacterium]|nr:hypothetical protein [Gammaproteobacteria bacterium]